MNHRIIPYFFLLILSTGGFTLSLLANSPKTGESIANRYARSDEIGPKFQEAHQPFKLDYRWKDNGIILKSGKGKTASEKFIDGKIGKSKKSKTLDSPKNEESPFLLPPQSLWGRSPSSSENVSITFKNSFNRSVRVYWVDIEGDLKNYGTIPPKEELSISTFTGHQWVLDFSANDLTGIFVASNRDCIARINLHSRQVAMKQKVDPPKLKSNTPSKLVIREHNVWLIRKDKKDIQLTRKGTKEDSFLSEFHYSPNNRYALGFQSTRVIPRKIPLLRSSPKDQIQPTLEFINYPKPGDPRPQRRPILFDLKKKTAILVDESSFLDSWSVQFKHWSKDNSTAHVLFNQRGHQELALLSIDSSTGKVSDLVRESPDTFVDYSQKTMLHWLDQSGQLIWASERSGWNHLYRIDALNGQVINPITKGKWVVRKIEHVDEKSEVVWFSALAIHPKQDPYHLHLAKVNFDGSDLTILTQGDGNHRWEFNPERTLFVDRWSRVDHPEVAELRSTRDGSFISELGRQDISDLIKEGYSMPIRFSAPGRDGKTKIHGILIQPTDSKTSMPGHMVFTCLKNLASRFPREDWPSSDLSSPKLMEWARTGDPRNFMIIAGKIWPMLAFPTVLLGSRRPLKNIPGSISPALEFMEEVPVDKMLYPPFSTMENFTKPPSATVDAMTTGWIKFGGTRHGWEKSALTMNKAPMFSTPIN